MKIGDQISVQLSSRDEICLTRDAQGFDWKVIGCLELIHKVRNFALSCGKDPSQWVPPEGVDHSSILLREVVLKAQGQWEYPYHEEELCHCRMVPTSKVDRAVIAGAHTSSEVSQKTSASTACGTCRMDVERIIEYRLNRVHQEQKKAA